MPPLHRLLLPLLLLWSSVGTAAVLPDYSAERQMFQSAREALRDGDGETYRQMVARLKDYPLLPYLSYWNLRGRLKQATAGEVDRYMETHPDLSISNRLRTAWLDELARRGDWKGYIRDYQPGLGTELTCTYHEALLRTGRTREALTDVEPLWLSGRSQPKACDPVFEAWRKAGKQTPALTWQRIALAMEAGQTRLARYLGRSLSADEQAWVDNWIQINDDPHRLTRERLHPDAHPQAAAILAHGLYRLARTDAEAAMDLWTTLSPETFLSEEQLRRIERTIAYRLGDSLHPEAQAWIERAGAHDPAVLEWATRNAVSRGQWQRVLELIAKLPPETAAEDTWRYWKARALQAQGEKEVPRQLLAGVAQERSYYGFLAADHLDLKYSFQEQPLEIPEAELKALVKKRPALARAHELLMLDERLDARREWYAALDGLSDRELQGVALLAHQWGWHDRAIITLARTSYNDDLSLRFPVPFRDLVQQRARAQSLDPAWVFAMLRQESAFGADARSPAGAMGLMQLMPATARQVARSLNTPLRSTTLLYEPDLNIQLGTAYLRRVLDRHDSNPVLATASYNAGPHRVERWRPEDSVMPAEQWVESIPFTETRNYVKRIFSYTPIYEKQLGSKVTRMSQRMPDVTPDSATR